VEADAEERAIAASEGMKPEDIPSRTLMALALAEAIKHVREADACLMSIKDMMYQEAEKP